MNINRGTTKFNRKSRNFLKWGQSVISNICGQLWARQKPEIPELSHKGMNLVTVRAPTGSTVSDSAYHYRINPPWIRAQTSELHSMVPQNEFVFVRLMICGADLHLVEPITPSLSAQIFGFRQGTVHVHLKCRELSQNSHKEFARWTMRIYRIRTTLLHKIQSIFWLFIYIGWLHLFRPLKHFEMKQSEERTLCLCLSCSHVVTDQWKPCAFISLL